MKLSSGRGDKGTTDLIYERKVPKVDVRIEAVGVLDEASESIGFAKALSAGKDTSAVLTHIQKDLYTIMAAIASCTEGGKGQSSSVSLEWLDERLMELEAQIPRMKGFIVPGSNQVSSAFGLARTVTRRAERGVVKVKQHDYEIDSSLIAYLNRLSSLLFAYEVLFAEDTSQAASDDK